MTGTGDRAGARPARYLEIDAAAVGQRIDNYLITHLKGVPRTRIYRILRRGEVRVNRGRVRPGYRLRDGDRIRIPPMRVPEERQASRPSPDAARSAHDWIIHEDQDLLVLDKPPGIAVHGGTSRTYGIIDLLREARSDPGLELVHRLDAETSGCLLVARHRQALRALHRDLRRHTVEKRYLALLKGVWTGGVLEVDLGLSRTRQAGGRRSVAAASEGKAALTSFVPLASTGASTRDGAAASLVEVRINTGRMHQIRVHAASVDRPVAGDRKYGDRELNRAFRVLGLRRQFLHASRIRFEHPGTSREVTFRAPLPRDLRAVLERVGIDPAVESRDRPRDPRPGPGHRKTSE